MRTFIQSANDLRFSECDRDLSAGGEGVMGTHIIWRNPSPPRKRAIQVSRVSRNPVAVFYQVAAPSGFKRLFQLIRTSGANDAA